MPLQYTPVNGGPAYGNNFMPDTFCYYYTEVQVLSDVFQNGTSVNLTLIPFSTKNQINLTASLPKVFSYSAPVLYTHYITTIVIDYNGTDWQLINALSAVAYHRKHTKDEGNSFTIITTTIQARKETSKIFWDINKIKANKYIINTF